MRKIVTKFLRWYELLSPTQKNELYICLAAVFGLIIGIII